MKQLMKFYRIITVISFLLYFNHSYTQELKYILKKHYVVDENGKVKVISLSDSILNNKLYILLSSKKVFDSLQMKLDIQENDTIKRIKINFLKKSVKYPFHFKYSIQNINYIVRVPNNLNENQRYRIIINYISNYIGHYISKEELKTLNVIDLDELKNRINSELSSIIPMQLYIGYPINKQYFFKGYSFY